MGKDNNDQEGVFVAAERNAQEKARKAKASTAKINADALAASRARNISGFDSPLATKTKKTPLSSGSSQSVLLNPLAK